LRISSEDGSEKQEEGQEEDGHDFDGLMMGSFGFFCTLLCFMHGFFGVYEGGKGGYLHVTKSKDDGDVMTEYASLSRMMWHRMYQNQMGYQACGYYGIEIRF